MKTLKQLLEGRHAVYGGRAMSGDTKKLSPEEAKRASEILKADRERIDAVKDAKNAARKRNITKRDK